MNPKLHLSLDVADFEQSVHFYSSLFNMEPTKLKPGYAKFDAAAPPVNLTLNQGSPCCVSGLNHLGVRVETTEDILAAKQRLEKAGFATRDEFGTTCCYAVQDKIWATDPTGYRWEVYVFKQDADLMACSPAGCRTDKPAAASSEECCAT